MRVLFRSGIIEKNEGEKEPEPLSFKTRFHSNKTKVFSNFMTETK